jgi:hypothetical protein
LDDDEIPKEPFFDQKYFLFTWDEEHPPIEIPPHVIEDKDNDWSILEE